MEGQSGRTRLVSHPVYLRFQRLSLKFLVYPRLHLRRLAVFISLLDTDDVFSDEME